MTTSNSVNKEIFEIQSKVEVTPKKKVQVKEVIILSVVFLIFTSVIYFSCTMGIR